MYTPLMYQISNHDCGPSSVINGLRQLFEREEIPPEIIKMIYATCMNEHSQDGKSCRGTDMNAMRFLSAQLNEYSPLVNFPLITEFYAQADVHLNADSRIVSWLKEGGMAIMRIFVGVGHYVLITKLTDDLVYIWDPFLTDRPQIEGVSYHMENSRDYNLIVSRKRFEQYEREMFMMSEEKIRNTLLLKRTD